MRSNVDSSIHIVRAVSIPHISDPIRGIKLDGYAEKFGLDVSLLSREGGPIEILVGVDAPEFHAGNTLVRENVAMHHTIISPAVYGSAASDIPGSHHV